MSTHHIIGLMLFSFVFGVIAGVTIVLAIIRSEEID